MVVLRVEQEVGAHDGHAHRHDGQDDEHQQHEAVHIVHLRSPCIALTNHTQGPITNSRLGRVHKLRKWSAPIILQACAEGASTTCRRSHAIAITKCHDRQCLKQVLEG